MHPSVLIIHIIKLSKEISGKLLLKKRPNYESCSYRTAIYESPSLPVPPTHLLFLIKLAVRWHDNGDKHKRVNGRPAICVDNAEILALTLTKMTLTVDT